MKPLPLALLVCCVAARLGAQTWFTSPIGLTEVEGNGVSSINPASFTASRLQFLDGNQRGMARPGIRALALRRDSYPAANTTAGARTLELGVVMAHTIQTAPSLTFAGNYLNGQSTQVYSLKPTNLPDLRPQGGTPGAWAITLPFDRTFTYNGAQDLLWEVASRNNTVTGAYWLDSATNGSAAGGGFGSFQYNGWQACTVPPNTSPFELITEVPRTDPVGRVALSWYTLNTGPVSAPGVLAFGIRDPNITGLFCAPLRTSFDVVVPVATTATGSLASAVAPLRVLVPLLGGSHFNLYTQFAALHVPTVQLYLTDATAHTLVPFTPPVLRACAAVVNTTSELATVGTPSSICLVARFEY